MLFVETREERAKERERRKERKRVPTICFSKHFPLSHLSFSCGSQSLCCYLVNVIFVLVSRPKINIFLSLLWASLHKEEKIIIAGNSSPPTVRRLLFPNDATKTIKGSEKGRERERVPARVSEWSCSLAGSHQTQQQKSNKQLFSPAPDNGREKQQPVARKLKCESDAQEGTAPERNTIPPRR